MFGFLYALREFLSLLHAVDTDRLLARRQKQFKGNECPYKCITPVKFGNLCDPNNLRWAFIPEQSRQQTAPERLKCHPNAF